MLQANVVGKLLGQSFRFFGPSKIVGIQVGTNREVLLPTARWQHGGGHSNGPRRDWSVQLLQNPGYTEPPSQRGE
jgi:hypothetical protein